MYIKNVEIENFRNYEKQKIELSESINVFYGDNAQGKTNLLEAIFMTAFGKSFRTSREKEIIKKNKIFSKVAVDYVKKDRAGNIKINLGANKGVMLNGVKLKRLSELLGNVNIVLFSPEDINLLRDEPANRRKFLDMMISQLRINYVYNLNRYKKTLEQKNNYLKSEKVLDDMLDVYDEKLAEYSFNIYTYRSEFLEKINEKVKKIHKEISGEDIDIYYKTSYKSKEECLKKLKEAREKDKRNGNSSVGAHRDDFKVFINGDAVNIYGSQGQNRTAVLSIKIAELNVVYDEIDEYPILLLDDFMSELDKKRISNFLKNIKDIQVIITCTDKINIDNIKEFYVEKGKIFDK